MFKISPTSTAKLTLAEIIHHLSQKEAVRGVVIMGSVAKNQNHLNSDYDVLIVLNNNQLPVHLVNTVVDERLAEFYFTHENTLDQLLAVDQLKVPDHSMLANYVRYISTGQIVFDPTGKLAKIKEFSEKEGWFQCQMWTDSDIYHEWFHTNYNVAQNRRYLAASILNPNYALALHFRLLYCVADIFMVYYRVRRLPWRGEKEMSHYLAEHDATFLETYRQYFAETDLASKVVLYEQLAAMALALVGPLWPSESTAVEFNEETEIDDGLVDRGLSFWEHLVSED